ncbi:M56 family metallopeptidase [Bacilliculturomica massiliensis]|uniref:M56 family metallopeptidase n=1 Tax=Bacilliculturomica massiliensis TaxID=1917867 RepID=UPI0010326A27|nr:M56 family metallopeptidase [Bacilliculturomica massiliensis]
MLNMTVTTSVLILAVLFMRRLLGRRISPELQYALWGILPLRMAVYLLEALFFTLPQSQFSAVYMAEGIAERTGVILGTGRAAGQMMGGGQIPGPGAGPAAGTASGGTWGALVSLVRSPDWHMILTVCWIAGAAAVLLWFAAVNYRFYRRLRTGRREFSEFSGIPVYQCQGLSSPCLTGLVKRAIYIPAEVAEDEDVLRYALIHEACHDRHGDLIWMAVRILMLTVFWFNPLMWAAAVLSKRDCELACDAAVIRQIGSGERLAYGKALVDMVCSREKKQTGTGSGGSSHIMCAATSMWDSAKSIRERVAGIVSVRRTAALGVAAVVLITAAAGACTFTDAASPLPGEARQKELLELGRSWAEAYCGRDGEALSALCVDEKTFHMISGVSGEEPAAGNSGMDPGEGDSLFGFSSPWPWFSEDCSVEVIGPKEVNVYFVVRTSDPAAWIEVMTLEVQRRNDGWKVAGVKDNDSRVDSKADFDFVYRHGYAWLEDDDFTEALQYQADVGQKAGTDRSELLDPIKAVPAALNLVNVSAKLHEGSSVQSGQAYVDLTWDDGTATVRAVQPRTLGAKGIWIPVSETFVGAAEREEILNFGKEWAGAFCSRNGQKLLALCKDEQVYRSAGGYFLNDPEPFNEGETGSKITAAKGESGPAEDDLGAPVIGMSSPWPWYDQECSYVISNGELWIYMWWHAGEDAQVGIQKIRFEKTETGTYLTTACHSRFFDEITSKEIFDQAFRFGYDLFSESEYSETYQWLVDQYSGNDNGTAGGGEGAESYKARYCDPFAAACTILHIGKDTEHTLKPETGELSGAAELTLIWKDGSVTIKMIQPGVQGKDGVWIPVMEGI